MMDLSTNFYRTPGQTVCSLYTLLSFLLKIFSSDAINYTYDETMFYVLHMSVHTRCNIAFHYSTLNLEPGMIISERLIKFATYI